MTNIEDIVNDLGEKLSKCDQECESMTKVPQKLLKPDLILDIEKVPRGLILEPDKTGTKNCIVVGINPAPTTKEELKHYQDNGMNYKSVKDCWEKHLKGTKYFANVRDVLKKLDYKGSILWTELVKCEKTEKNTPEKWFHTKLWCTNKFLINEVKQFDKESTIFALGNEAFDFCSLRFPEKIVVGIPHPTGSYGTFKAFKMDLDKNAKNYLKKLNDLKHKNKCINAIKFGLNYH